MVLDENQLSIWKQGLRQQIFLGDEAFAQRMQALIAEQDLSDDDIPKQQRLAGFCSPPFLLADPFLFAFLLTPCRAQIMSLFSYTSHANFNNTNKKKTKLSHKNGGDSLRHIINFLNCFFSPINNVPIHTKLLTTDSIYLIIELNDLSNTPKAFATFDFFARILLA